MEPVKNAVAVTISEETHIAAARRAAAEYVRRLRLSEELMARAELVVVELATNVLRHAGRGRVLLTPLPSGCGLRLLAVDSGPGLGDVARALSDGYSTAGTPGLGLGAVRRLVTGMDVYSRRAATGGGGAVVEATLREMPSAAPGAVEAEAWLREDMATAVVSVPLEGESVNGDSWALYPPVKSARDRTVYLMVDGLGHGPFAAEAAGAAVRVANVQFEADPRVKLSTVLERMQMPLHGTRGAAVMLVSVTTAGREVTMLGCGIGNISVTVVTPEGESRSMVSHNGTVGHRMPRVQEFPYAAPSGSLLCMHSDGISTRWKMGSYPGLAQRSPAVVAGVLLRDAARERDDATMLVSRLGLRNAEDSAHG